MSTSPNTRPSRLADTPIAIVGMSALFPGAANLKEYWELILNKVDAITEVPSSRWDTAEYYDPDPQTPDRVYSKRGGFLPDIDFNPLDFGLPPNILEVTDSSQLLALFVAKAALQDANLAEAHPEILEKTGIILGVCGGQKLMVSLTSRLQDPIWRKVLRSAGLSESDTETVIGKFKQAYVGWEENAFPGLLGNVIAGRVANRLNLGGTNCVVDAACGSSLAAVKMAISDLVEHRSDVMITGGVDTDNSPFMYMCFSKTPAFTEAELVQPFDKNSRGIMIGEGLGMVVLKRLADAERDQDRIYAVIKGIGSSSDGRFKSIYAPRQEGQVTAIRRAHEDANVAAASVQLIEAHGTGTRAGDATEFEGLRTAYQHPRNETQYLALGSVKAQIGHTKAAAGAAGLIKAALGLHHKVLPPMINIEEPNPALRIEESPLYLSTEAHPWCKGTTPRRAGVSAFGFGGTNFHFILEEAPQPAATRLHATAQPILLCAASPEALLSLCENTRTALQSSDANQVWEELVQTSAANLPEQSQARLGFVATSPTEALAALETALPQFTEQPDAEQWSLKSGVYFRRSGLETQGKVVALFSGQGSQYLHMVREVFGEFPEMFASLEAIDQLFGSQERVALSRVVFPPPAFNDETSAAQTEALQDTACAQPAIGSISAGFYRILQRTGFQPDFTAGHSFGELTALWAGGVLDDQAYHTLAVERGRAMAAPDDPHFDAGTMMAVMGKINKLEPALAEFPNLKLANFNSNKQVVVAGPKDEIQRAHDALKAQRFSVVLLPVSAAFHTPLVGHAQKPFAEVIARTPFATPQVPVFSNETAQPYPQDPQAIKAQLQAHILQSVQFKQQIENIHAAGGRIFVEFGPKNVLTKLTENILAGHDFQAIALNANPKDNSARQFRSAFVQLQVLGLPLRNVDPYRERFQSYQAAPSPANIRLNGANYVRPATQQAFEDALNDGFQIRLPQASQREPSTAEEER